MVKSVNIGKSAAKYPLYISFKNNFELYLFQDNFIKSRQLNMT